MDGSISRSRSDARQGTDAANTYELRCNDCAYRTTVTGDLAAVFAVLDDHEQRRDDGGLDHFVDCHRVDAPDSDSQ